MALTKDQAERIRELDAEANRLAADAAMHAEARSKHEQAKRASEKKITEIREKILAIYRESDKPKAA